MIGDRIYTAIDNAPEHAAALGRLIGHWAILERFLVGTMQYLLGIVPLKADLVYQEIVSTRAKIIMMRRINHHFTSDALLKTEIDTLLSKTQELNTKRNSFIHASWVSDSDELVRFEHILSSNHKKTWRKPANFTPQDIQNVVEEVAKLSASFGVLLTRLLGGPLEQTSK